MKKHTAASQERQNPAISRSAVHPRLYIKYLNNIILKEKDDMLNHKCRLYQCLPPQIHSLRSSGKIVWIIQNLLPGSEKDKNVNYENIDYIKGTVDKILIILKGQ